jgi:hypothetical protein
MRSVLRCELGSALLVTAALSALLFLAHALLTAALIAAAALNLVIRPVRFLFHLYY